ncbi:hypothetical protein H5410_055733 [Solanum commersonii]|uniref:Uncharacterized protein n=1 Tax=Solanum commersonii TaxID=4109 RepID=A0A9J5WJZ8_SOLCO|nr:hypothetical protein H5410_055733 [Solanum commersonii]
MASIPTLSQNSQTLSLTFTIVPLPPSHNLSSWLELTLQGKQLAFHMRVGTRPVTLIVQDPTYLAQIVKEGMDHVIERLGTNMDANSEESTTNGMHQIYTDTLTQQTDGTNLLNATLFSFLPIPLQHSKTQVHPFIQPRGRGKETTSKRRTLNPRAAKIKHHENGTNPNNLRRTMSRSSDPGETAPKGIQGDGQYDIHCPMPTTHNFILTELEKQNEDSVDCSSIEPTEDIQEPTPNGEREGTT